MQSIVDLDPKGLNAALKRGDSLDILSEQDDEEYLNAHIHLNFFPESDELEGAKEAHAKLNRGAVKYYEYSPKMASLCLEQ